MQSYPSPPGKECKTRVMCATPPLLHVQLSYGEEEPAFLHRPASLNAMHLPPALDSSIVTSPLYRRSSHRGRQGYTDPSTDKTPDHIDTMASSSLSSINIRSEKFSPPTNPLPRVRSPFALKRRSRTRTLGRVAILVIALVVCGMGVNEWICEEHGCLTRHDLLSNMDETRVRHGDYIGGGSVIGKFQLTEEEYERSRLEHMTPEEKHALASQQTEDILAVEGEDPDWQVQEVGEEAAAISGHNGGDMIMAGGEAMLVEMDDAAPVDEVQQPPNNAAAWREGYEQVRHSADAQADAVSATAGEEMPMLGEMDMGVF